MVDKEKKQAEPAFEKEQFLLSAKYASRRDLIGAILCDDKKYTISQVDNLIDEYMKGKVI